MEGYCLVRKLGMGCIAGTGEGGLGRGEEQALRFYIRFLMYSC